MIDNFVIYGERNSGTNYLETLLTGSSFAFTSNGAFNIPAFNSTVPHLHDGKFGHKHFFGFFDKLIIGASNSLFIGIIRDPYEWIIATHKSGHHIPPENQAIENFLKNEWYSINNDENSSNYGTELLGDRDFTTGTLPRHRIGSQKDFPETTRYKNVFDLRQKKLKYLVHTMPQIAKNYELIRYEDLCRNPHAFVKKISEKYNLKINNSDILEPIKKSSYLDFIDSEIKEIIDDNLDWQIENEVGYFKRNKNNVSFKNKESNDDTNLVGAFYYTWYRTNTNWKKEAIRLEKWKAKPELGYYDSLNAKTLREHEKYATQAGVDYMISSFNGDYSYSHLDFLRDNLESLKFCIHYETVNIFPPPIFPVESFANQIKKDFDIFSKRYLSSKNYLRINNRPVVYIYTSRAIRGDLEIINDLRDILTKETGENPILCGDEIWWQDRDYIGNVDRISKFDYIYGYNMYSEKETSGLIGNSFIDKVETVYQDFYSKCSKLGVGLIGNIMPRYDDSYARNVDGGYRIPSNGGKFYENFYKMFKKYFLGKPNMLTITSFNEWFEDTQIEPCVCQEEINVDETIGYGDSFLNITKEISQNFKSHNLITR